MTITNRKEHAIYLTQEKGQRGTDIGEVRKNYQRFGSMAVEFFKKDDIPNLDITLATERDLSNGGESSGPTKEGSGVLRLFRTKFEDETATVKLVYITPNGIQNSAAILMVTPSDVSVKSGTAQGKTPWGDMAEVAEKVAKALKVKVREITAGWKIFGLGMGDTLDESTDESTDNIEQAVDPWVKAQEELLKELVDM